MKLMMVEAAAGPAWVVRPLAPSAGIRLGDAAHVEALVQPIVRRTQSELVKNPELEGLANTSLGGELNLVGRISLSKTKARGLWTLGVDGRWVETFLTDFEDNARDRSLTAWTGPSFSLGLGRQWSIGADVELFAASYGDQRVVGFNVIAPLRVTSVAVLTGGHLWFAFRPGS